MKLLLDKNLSRRLDPFLQNACLGTSQVVLFGMETASNREIWQTDKEPINKAFILFEDMFEDKYPKAVINFLQDLEELKTFFDFPAQHWLTVCMTNPIESTLATICLHTHRTKACLTDNKVLHMMFKLSDCAQKSWRRLRGFDFLVKVIACVRLLAGVEASYKPKRKAA